MRILIAEDDQSSSLELKRSLERMGHDCIQTEDGPQAWELYQAISPEAVVVDDKAPGLPGIEFCRRVRAVDRDHDRHTCVIVVTGLAEADRRIEIMEAGADDYLIKPLDTVELRARMIAVERHVQALRETIDQRKELDRLQRELVEDGRRDPLTRMGTKLRLMQDLETLAGRAERYGHACSIALFDIDDFKKYNDTCGLPAGDNALRAVAHTLLNHARSGDMTYRYGGEEFIVVLPEQNLEGTLVAVERRRKAVEILSLPHPGRGASGVLTISAGVAVLEPGAKDPADALIRRAEAALLIAKQRGKNQIVTDRELAAASPGGAEVGASR